MVMPTNKLQPKIASFEIQNNPQVKDLKKRQVLAVADSANLIAIFSKLYLGIETVTKFSLFILAGIFKTFRFIFMVREYLRFKAALAQTTDIKKANILNAKTRQGLINIGIEAITTLAVLTAVAIALSGAAIFGNIGGWIFTCTIGIETLIQGGRAIKNFYKGFFASGVDANEKSRYRKQALENAVGFVTGALSTVASAFVMLVGKPVMAILGIVAGGIGVIYGLYDTITTRKKFTTAAIVIDKTLEDNAIKQKQHISYNNNMRSALNKVMDGGHLSDDELEEDTSLVTNDDIADEVEGVKIENNYDIANEVDKIHFDQNGKEIVKYPVKNKEPVSKLRIWPSSTKKSESDDEQAIQEEVENILNSRRFSYSSDSD
jgi:hypothetical protein